MEEPTAAPTPAGRRMTHHSPRAAGDEGLSARGFANLQLSDCLPPAPSLLALPWLGAATAQSPTGGPC